MEPPIAANKRTWLPAPRVRPTPRPHGGPQRGRVPRALPKYADQPGQVPWLPAQRGYRDGKLGPSTLSRASRTPREFSRSHNCRTRDLGIASTRSRIKTRMPCLLLVIAGLFPRVMLVLAWLFTNMLERAYHGIIIPIIGFIFLPLTTLCYAWLISSHLP